MFSWDIFAIIALTYIVGHILYLIYYAFDLFHFNPFVQIEPLTESEVAFISQNFPVYKEFSDKQKLKCKRRVSWFKNKKKFVFFGEVNRQEELKLLLSATTVIMTLGLRKYRMMVSLEQIIIYPTQYYSRINKQYHLGEYNPSFKAIILSADKIWEGFANRTDNRNLAMHEFAHALSFEMNKSRSWQGHKFRVGLRRIKKLFKEEDFLVKLAASQYFREYGLTNLQEFFSVAVENYFETPKIFKNDFPYLFAEIRSMLNMDFRYDKESSTFKISLES